jgi:hypothetical protein
MIFIFMRNLIRRILREENENIPKSKMMKLIEKLGIASAVKTVGLDNILDILDTTAIDLFKEFILDKEFSTKKLNKDEVGTYDFNFVVKDIEYTDDTWDIYVEILEGGTVIVYDKEYELLNPPIGWERDHWWWEVPDEVSTIIVFSFLKPMIPKGVELQITHNLE